MSRGRRRSRVGRRLVAARHAEACGSYATPSAAAMGATTVTSARLIIRRMV